MNVCSHASTPEEPNTALLDGVWQPDGSRHTLAGQVRPASKDDGVILAPAQSGRPVLKVAYFFSGTKRKASVGNFLKEICEKEGYGLMFNEVDILVGGSEHDLVDLDRQEAWLERVEAGEFDCIVNSPPCGPWSRANWANLSGPTPCRSRRHPWGFANNLGSQRRRAENGNTSVHFTIRAIGAAQASKAKGELVLSLLEHPEDLGACYRTPHKGIGKCPASIWQLPELRRIYGAEEMGVSEDIDVSSREWTDANPLGFAQTFVASRTSGTCAGPPSTLQGTIQDRFRGAAGIDIGSG